MSLYNLMINYTNGKVIYFVKNSKRDFYMTLMHYVVIVISLIGITNI